MGGGRLAPVCRSAAFGIPPVPLRPGRNSKISDTSVLRSYSRACSTNVDTRKDVIAGLVPATPLMEAGRSDTGWKHPALLIGVAGTSPAMTVPWKRNAL
jgi:hypothetical protein